MAVERGDSSASVGATVDDSPSTFEQSTLKGTTTTGNARLIVRDASQISVIDTNGWWASNTVEGVLDEIAQLTGLSSYIQDQIDALDGRVTANEADIVLLEAADVTLQDNIDTEEAARIAADALKNILMNTDFAINQRGYTSGSATALYEFTYDRWASWVANSTLSVSGIVATIDHTTASTEGSFYTTVEEGLMVEGDWYTLSWEGTALADVAGLTNQTSPVTFRAPAPSGGADVVLIFHGDGVTLSRAKLEEGTLVTPWEKPDKATELSRCQRYYEIATSSYRGEAASIGYVGSPIAFKQTKAVVPTVTLLALGGTSADINFQATYGTTIHGSGAQWYISATTAYTYGSTFSVVAEL